MASSKQTILALKGKRYAILAGEKTCYLYHNIYYGTSGDYDCCEELKLSVKKAEFPRVESVKAAAKFLANLINTVFSKKWAAAMKVGVDILLVGNMIYSNEFHIYRIWKRQGAAARGYKVREIEDPAFAIGGGAAEITEMLATFRRNCKLKEAHRFAFKLMRKSTKVIQIVSFCRDFAKSSVLQSDDGNWKNTVRSDSRIILDDTRKRCLIRSCGYTADLSLETECKVSGTR